MRHDTERHDPRQHPDDDAERMRQAAGGLPQDERSTEVPTTRTPTHDETGRLRDERLNDERLNDESRADMAPDEGRFLTDMDDDARRAQPDPGTMTGPAQPREYQGFTTPGRDELSVARAGEHIPEGGEAMAQPPGEAATTRPPMGEDMTAGPRSTDRIAPEMRGAGHDSYRVFESTDADRLRGEWQRVQSTFVDDPREAVLGADALVGEAIQALQTKLSERHQSLRGSSEDTEDLRQTLQKYRALLDQLLDT